MHPIIEVRGLTKLFAARHGSPSVHALKNVDLVQAEGEFLCIMGPSGCGKTTLLNIIAGFETTDSGTCQVRGKPVTDTGPDRGVVFQEYALFPWMTVKRNVVFAMKAAGKWSAVADARADDILDRMGLANFHDALPKSLSGGMRQRVAIARLLAIDSPVMLMDEPFGALDSLTRSVLQVDLMNVWRETRKTILFVTHNVDEAVYLADRIVLMTPRPGRIVREVPVDLPRPRDITDARFNQYKRDILDTIHPSIQD
jgi:NitT/TauT family transport system ATP-binding protein